jgi:iron-sulfur cluster assembly accessory protein
MITLTDSAKEKITSLLQEENDPGLAVRTFVEGGGCQGFQYGFTFDKDIEESDTVIEINEDAKFVVDGMSALYLAGSTIDYKDELDGSGFNITNPNAASSCSCGNSFACG